ncbi:rho guanine nucleotide exchange factor 37 [Mixophyes fleayi]|uniref:rho guanine nucleotide exchange factor 37 n=1 Tax=Mixophyes fleayi TaxID=3061075 RepID=UPI003F4DD318
MAANRRGSIQKHQTSGRSVALVESSSSGVSRVIDNSPSRIESSPEPETVYDEDHIYDTSPLFVRSDSDQLYQDVSSVNDSDDHLTCGYPLGFSEYMDETAIQGSEPLSSYGSHDLKTCSPPQSGSTSPVQGSPCSVHKRPTGSNMLYENIPQNEEPLYGDVEYLPRTANKAVEELIVTESSYVHSLRLLTSHIQPKLEEMPEIDVKCLFSNLDEILLAHESFLNELEKTENDEQNQLANIGIIFQEFSKDMENAYSIYCSGNTRAVSLLQNYQETQVAEKILEILKSGHSRYPDLSYYLVLPVQRITKYPLLLEQIQKTVPQNKDSHCALQRALDTMKEVNVNINENKRRKEVASKYLRLDQRTLREKVSNLNTHTISKKSQRISQFLKQQAGVAPKKEDKEFDSLADRFQRLAAVVNQMEENVVSYVKNVQEFILIQPQTYPLEYLQQSIHPFQGFSQELCNNIYPVFKRRVQLMVLQPLISLSECLKGPKNLIRKRMDKLLDYENLEEKYSDTGRMTLEEEDIVKNYKAIHSLLLSELPCCISLSLQWLHTILLNFIALQKDLAELGLHAAEIQASQMEHSMVPEAQFRRWVEDCIQYTVSQLNEFTKKFDEVLPAPVIQEHTPALGRQIQQLLQHYGPKKLYQVVSNVKGSREVELTLSRGAVVAVIQFADSKGSKNRWLVDTGGSRGYVPCSKLQPYQVTQSPNRSQNSPEPNSTLATPQMCPYPTTSSQDTTTAFQIVAGYSFTARSSYEVSIMEGEQVTVLEPHDKNGSPEWSLVEVGGQRGYVPSNYLVRIPVQENNRRTSLY